MTLFELLAKLVLDSSEFNEGLSEAEGKAGTFERTFTQVTQKLASALTAAGIVKAIGNIAKAFQQAVNDAATYADTVDKGSRSLSMSTDTYQVWQHVLQQSGSDISAVSRGWLNLTDAIDTAKSHQEEWAQDTTGVKAALDSLTIDPTNFETVDELFASIVTSLAQMPSGVERDNLVTALFGRNGRELNAMLDSGVQGIEALKKEAYDLGLVMSGEDVASGVAYGDAVANMNAAVDALKQNIVTGLFPLLTDAANMISQIVAFFNGRTQERGIDEWFSDIDDSMREAFSSADSGEAEVGALIETLKSMSDETGTCAENLQVWQGVAQAIIELCPELAAQIDLVNGKYSEQKATLEETAEAWFTNARAQAASNALQEKQNALAQKAAEVTEKQIEATVKQAEAEGKRQQALEKINQQLENMGLSEQEGFRPEDIANKSLFELWDMVQNVLPFYSGMDANLQTQILDMLNAGTQAEESAQGIQEEVAALQEALSGATAEYQAYAEAVNSYLQTIQQGIAAIPDSKTVTIHVVETTSGYSVEPTRHDSMWADVIPVPHARGLNYVPYDGYIAELHRGEAVLNQDSAYKYRQGGGVGGFDMREIGGMIADAVAAAVSDIQINMDGRQVGNAVTDYVSKNIYRQQNGRRFAAV